MAKLVIVTLAEQMFCQSYRLYRGVIERHILIITMLGGMVMLLGCAPNPDVNINVPVCDIEKPLEPECDKVPDILRPNTASYSIKKE